MSLSGQHERIPGRPVRVMADDDDAGHKAAKAAGLEWRVPDFSGLDRAPGDNDYNDYVRAARWITYPGAWSSDQKSTLADQLAGECYDARWLSENTPQPREWLIQPVLPAGEFMRYFWRARFGENVPGDRSRPFCCPRSL